MDYDTDNVDDSPLEIGFTPKSQVSIDPEMIRAIAIGLEEPAEVAARYGFTGERWEQLQKWQPFLTTVAKLRAEFEQSGVTFRNKASFMADQLAEQVFLAAMAPHASHSQKMTALQYFAKMGDLEPKVSKVDTAGPGFSIQINLSGQSMTLTAPQPAEQATVIDMPAPQAPVFAPLVDPEFLRELQTQGD